MNSNYFLFATLEQARNVAQGRVQQDTKSLTVLTGTPVAGMVYLDRPNPAGYFIFPDLSVRHEGKYRLSFSLYEELKEEKDQDKTEDGTKPSGPEHVTHRLEVKSSPFTVFSAKKFPGLTESTTLSRMVAEQGCRVRIRRDVRMRRRETKANGKDWDGYEEETADVRARMSATPDPAGYATHGYIGDPINRPRSGSNVSHHSLAPSLALSRRTSLQDMHQTYQQPAYGTGPHTPQSAYPQSSPYGPSPSQPYSQSPFAQQQPAMQPPPTQYSQSAYQPPPPPMSPVGPSQHSYTGYGSATPPPLMTQSQLAQSAPTYEGAGQSQRMSADYSVQPANDYRRSSGHYAAALPPPSSSNYAAPTFQQQQAVAPQPSYQQQASGYTMPGAPQPFYRPLDGRSSRHPPPEPIQPPTRPTGASTPLSARSFNGSLPPLNTSLFNSRNMEPSSPASSGPQSSYYTGTATGSEAHKRSYGQIYNDRFSTQPLKQGARPDAHAYGRNSVQSVDMTADEGDLEADAENKELLSYPRAHGGISKRFLPSQS